jgi:hypothetical protein
VHGMISALVTAGIADGFLVSPRLKDVYWRPGDRPLPAPKVTVARESPLWVDPAEIPAADDVARLGKALTAGFNGERPELMAKTAAYSGLRWGEMSGPPCSCTSAPSRACSTAPAMPPHEQLNATAAVQSAGAAMTGRLIRITTALAVVAVAAVAAIISYQHGYELVRSHSESGATARLAPFTVDGLICAAFMVILDATRRSQRVPPLASWSLAVGIVATVGANLAHGVVHGPVGALVSAWPGVAFAGSFELLMMLIRTGHRDGTEPSADAARYHPAPASNHDVPLATSPIPSLEQTVRARHKAGHSTSAMRGRRSARLTTSETSPLSRARSADIRSSRPSSAILSISPSGIRRASSMGSRAAAIP